MVINIDIDPVEDEQEALTLMIHHLKLASKYFEATPQVITVDQISDHFSYPAIAAWLREMDALYPDNEG